MQQHSTKEKSMVFLRPFRKAWRFAFVWFADDRMISLFLGKVSGSSKDQNFAQVLRSMLFWRFSVVRRGSLVK